MSSDFGEGTEELNKVFQDIPIKLFPTPSLGRIIVLKSDTPLIEAVKVLSRNHVLSAPVRDVTQPDSATWSDKYLGMLDVVGVVFYMLETLLPEGKEPVDFESEMENHEAFKKLTVKDATTMSRFAPFVPVELDTGSLLDPMLLCGLHAIRRVPVVKSAGDIHNIVTQSALVQTLSANLDQKRFHPVSKKTLKELNLGDPKKVLSVKSSAKLKDAFDIIRDADVSAVPVLDESGVVIGNISARDVRYIVGSAKLYKLLKMPISTYLEVVTDGRVHSAITCKPDATMEKVIRLLVENRIHRIYVTDDADKPVRVISLRDIITKFVKEPEGYFGHYFS